MRFRPAPVPTVFVIIGLFILINLGAWQYRRYGQTEQRLADVSARMEGAAITNEGLAAPPAELTWAMAELKGEFSDTPPFLITNRYEFNQAGYEIVQTFLPEGGAPMLVSRGWAPRNKLDEVLAGLKASPPATVRGMLLDLAYFRDAQGSSLRRFFLGIGFSTPQERPPLPASADRPELWMPGAYAVMADRSSPALTLLLVEGEPLKAGERKRPEPLPVRGYHANPKVSPHLQYMGTWWLIAGTLLVIWVVTGLSRGKRLAQAESPGSAGAES